MASTFIRLVDTFTMTGVIDLASVSIIIITLFSTKIAVTTIPESQLSAGFTVCVQAVDSHGG